MFSGGCHELWAEVEELLLDATDRCLLITRLPTVYKKHYDRPLPINCDINDIVGDSTETLVSFVN